MTITNDTPVTEALKASKKVKEVFIQYGLQCFSCQGSSQDKIYHIVQNNGLDGDSFLKDLNKALK